MSGPPGATMRGCACAGVLVAALVWALLFIRAARHYARVATLGYPDFTGRWDAGVWLPLGMALGLLLGFVVFTFVLRSAEALIALSFLALCALLPYLVMTGGGM